MSKSKPKAKSNPNLPAKNNHPGRTIVFFHPDLGIGGAERLIIDAAVGLQDLGHRVVIYTAHRDKGHCFDEARDGTLDVRVRGNTLFPPTFLGGRFKILLTILRHYHLLFSIAFFSQELLLFRPDAFFVDQLSAGIPLIRYFFPDIRILFYCHFPDLLLVQGREKGGMAGLLRRTWRIPFDALEGWSMRGADRVVVNSGFTRGIVRKVWGDGVGGERGVGIVYPCVTTAYDGDAETGGQREGREGRGGGRLFNGKKLILSINRYERKKDVALAIRAFARLAPEVREKSTLVIAGGYDYREVENVSYHEELVALASSLDLNPKTTKSVSSPASQETSAIPEEFINTEAQVLFLLSVPAQLKALLLQSTRLLVYTPQNEHFGIVPLEAMRAGVPVLAANSGGPLETVVEGQTGWLRDVSDVAGWTAVMQKVVVEMTDAEAAQMGSAGRHRVRAEFSQEKMAARLEEEVEEMIGRPRARTWELQDVLLAVGVGGVVALMLMALLYRMWNFLVSS